MRTNIEIDDDLIRAAMQVSGLRTKRAAVEEGLRLLIRLKRQADVRTLFGQVRWEGDLDGSRAGRVLPE
ncbi:MAG: type II toxin-antitoxin system VapB family antitoxin [Rhodospirillales bacterium]|nr:type II toxin-antitoxin system VapB family antitoxin [Rhodospirillales bacterium]